jgi:hypothetical protein
MPWQETRPIDQKVVDPITAVPNDLRTADFKGQFRTQDHICIAIRSRSRSSMRASCSRATALRP